VSSETPAEAGAIQLPGILLVLSGPSGAGKSSIAQGLLEQTPELAFSVSHTTRTRRDGEVEGRHYHFIDEPSFRSMAARGEFLEWAKVHDRLYGTAAGPVRRTLGSGRDVLLDIDVQGAAQVRNQYPEAVGVFVLPPDFQALRSRLMGRSTDSPEQIDRRLAIARQELQEFQHYHYIIVNRILDSAVSDVRAILDAERHRASRMDGEAVRVLDGFPRGSAT
jgi:guanylate kinase